MAKTKNRIKKMTFQTQERKLDYTPLSEDDKYIIEMAGYRKQGHNDNDNEGLGVARRDANENESDDDIPSATKKAKYAFKAPVYYRDPYETDTDQYKTLELNPDAD